MKIFDITLTITPDLATWPGDPTPEYIQLSDVTKGDLSNVTDLRIGSHTGTHVDAPSHLFPQSVTVDQLPIDRLIGAAWVCAVPDHIRRIDSAFLEGADIPYETSRLILRTANSRFWRDAPSSFSRDFVSVTPDGASWMVDRGLLLVGIDYLSIDSYDSVDLPAHRILLSSDVLVVEGLDLSEVEPGNYYLLCLPLKLSGGDGAPARVLLLESWS